MNVTVAQNAGSGRVRITVDTDLPGLQSLHWGIVPWGPFGDNHWEAPAAELRPPVRVARASAAPRLHKAQWR